MLHLEPHWNWPGKEGQEIEVDALSNAPEVELFLNGESLGRKPVPRNYHATWQVKYAPGTLSAKGYDNGKVVSETKVETTGLPASVELTPDRSKINANGEDLSVFTVSVKDEKGRVVPTAMNKTHFQLEGAGNIIGVGNGDPSCHEPDTYVAQAPVLQPSQWVRSVFNGFAQVIVQSTKEPGTLTLTAISEGLKSATVSVQSQPCTPRPSVP